MYLNFFICPLFVLFVVAGLLVGYSFIRLLSVGTKRLKNEFPKKFERAYSTLQPNKKTENGSDEVNNCRIVSM